MILEHGNATFKLSLFPTLHTLPAWQIQTNPNLYLFTQKLGDERKERNPEGGLMTLFAAINMFFKNLGQ